MTDENNEEPVTEIVVWGSIYPEPYNAELEEKVEKAVRQILAMDDRFANADIETIDAIRDWVRAEAVLSRAFSIFMAGGTTASTERMFRHAALHKNALRDEIFGKYKGRRAKKDEIDWATKILVNSGIIKPETEVDILADKT